MRAASLIISAAIVVGLAQPAKAECFGRGQSVVCIDENGEVWTPNGGSSDDYDARNKRSKSPPIAKYPNAAAGPETKPAPPGETGVLRPSGESGNAWIMKPQGSGGATVLSGQGSAPPP
jgi:hypothetical protein